MSNDWSIGRLATWCAGALVSAITYKAYSHQQRRREHIQDLEQRGIIIHNPDTYFLKRNILKRNGIKQLQIITDFDRTLSAYRRSDGTLNPTSHGIMEISDCMPPEYRKKSKELFDKYCPLERSLVLTRAEKEKYMIEWWTYAHENLIHYGTQKSYIPLSIKSARMELRRGAADMLRTLHQHNVPVLVFSAGLSDTLEEFLSASGVLSDNMHVVSNRMIFDDQGRLVGFNKDIIHSMNKNYTHVRGSPFEEQTIHHKSAILLGDSLTDYHMADGIGDAVDVVLSVGFLNDHADVNMQPFRQTFDVVICNDGSMEYVTELVHTILSS